ncbi:glutathione ABC transporter substrate-binding protein [Alkalihalobacillus sp. 1P02AB]|uniref:glutathione ABC transporter substrate-binding protein n=1 Tax=Alkalihalobacillus sp. 1P02AB TaxID=3132260 RepID=UPI0039A72446
MKKLAFISFIFILITLVACSGQSNESEGNTATEQASGGDLVVDLTSAPVSLDPHAANDGNSLYVMSAIYDTLVFLDKDLTLKPGLAESYEQIEDTVWELKLRQGIEFHDGTPFNAEVVKVNFDRIFDKDVASPVGFLFDMVTNVEVIDEYTVHIETEFPFVALPAHLAHPAGHMISKEAIEADYEAMENGAPPFAYVNENPIGTGYFKYESSVPGENVTLTKNEDYWDIEANVDKVTFKVVPEDLTRIAELQTEEADIIYPVNPNDINQLENTDGTVVQQSDSSNLTYIGFNLEVEPFNDKRVRHAITMAIDKEELIDGIVDGVALPAQGFLAPTVYGYSDDITPLTYNVEEAKSLLEEAGYADGFQATILTTDLRSNINIAEYAQAQLAPLGIDLSIQIAEQGAYLDATAKGNHQLFVGSWGTVTLDADYGLYGMFHSSNVGAPGNRSFIQNDDVDALLEAGRKEMDEATRLELYKEVQQLLVDEAPLVPVYHSILLTGLRDNVEGYFQYPSSFLFLRDVELKE